MPKPSKKYHYKSVTLPEPMLKVIEDFITENPELGYGSVTDFIKDSIRKQIAEYVKKKKE